MLCVVRGLCDRPITRPEESYGCLSVVSVVCIDSKPTISLSQFMPLSHSKVHTAVASYILNDSSSAVWFKMLKVKVTLSSKRHGSVKILDENKNAMLSLHTT